MARPTFARIDLDAVAHNVRAVKALIGEAKICAAVKADAYGHGMLPVSKVLLNRGSCQMLAVATLEEAILLRKQFNRRFSIL
ncbi:MAG: alanine racemase, partial [Gammaproteobacteria bacterium]|nr:alanine racemase [Gammaproteobacteria bacterium]